MSVRLVIEVLDHAPAELTPAERLLLVVIAEFADGTTRRCSPGRDALIRRTGLDHRHLTRVLTQLAACGYEVRVPAGVDKKGKFVFANKGHRTIFEVPVFRDSKVDTGDPL